MSDLVQKLVGALDKLVERFKDHEDAGPRGETWQSDEFLAELAEARAALSEAKAGGWQPIETAPKDGTRFIAWRKYSTRPLIARYWKDFGWFEDEDGLHLYNLTHWQPLPAPPAQRGEG